MPGLYIHIPFCKAKCRYCDFVSFPVGKCGGGIADIYIDAIKTEILGLKERYGSGIEFDTIYVGGGTPGILPPHLIARLFENLDKNFKISQGAEITFECNPESIDDEKLRILKDSGVTRLSIGAQSLNDEILRYLGRVHNSEEIRRKFFAAREAGFDNINIDLIFGVPGFTVDDWKKDIENALALFAPRHISIYALSIEEGTELAKKNVKIHEDTQRDMYESARKILKANGYIHYEISNFARDKNSECRHNINYWRTGEYLGLGVAAAGYFNGVRYKNTSSLEEYLRSPADLSLEEEIIDERLARSEKFFLGLRLIDDGVKIDSTDEELYGDEIRRLLLSGLVRRENGFLKLSPEAAFVSNQVFVEFV